MTDLVNPAGDQLVISDGISDAANEHYGFTYPQTVTLSNGNVLVVGLNGSYGIIGSLYDASGTLIATDLVLSSQTSSFGQFDVVGLDNGGFAISASGAEGFVKLFDSAGQATTAEIALDSSPATSVNDPSMTLLADGNVLISWSSTIGVTVARVIDQTGATVDDFTIRPDASTNTEVAGLPDGGFVAVWEDSSGVYGSGSTHVIVGHKYAADGSSIGSDFVVGAASIYPESNPSVAVLADGTIAVAFRHFAVPTGWPSGTTEVVVRLVHPDGTTDPLISVSHPVNVTLGNHEDRQEEFPQIIALADGGFAVGYTATDSYGGYGGRDYYVATFDSDGNRVTGNQLANDVHGTASWGSLAVLGDGSIMAVWGNGGAQGRLFEATHLDGVTVDGDATDNDLSGGSLNDVLNGYEGSDQLDGGAGADVMRGGDGDDHYVVDDSRDSVIEDKLTDGGNDTVTASADYRLAEGMYVENLVAIEGSADIDLTGNGYDQSLQGNDGNNVLDGGGGEDSFAGGAGDDTYVIMGDRNYGTIYAANVVTENAGEGTDTVEVALGSYTLGANLENLTGTESQAQTLTGNELDNVITGGNGDALSGLAGNDVLIRSDLYGTMAGGTGDDIYIILYSADAVTENVDEGMDEVRIANGSYTLGANLENLMGTGNGQTLTGNGVANLIQSTGTGNDILNGLAGDDALSGGAGNDQVNGGDGVDSALFGGAAGGITVDLKAGTATGDGNDTLSSIENVWGSDFDDVIVGDDANNMLGGLDGDDTLRGGQGDDILQGGFGNDLLSEASGDFGPFGNDLYDGGEGSDRVSYFTTYGPGVTVDLRLAGPQDTGSQGTDTLIGIEHITANYGDDTLTGNDEANWFWTFSGHDVLSGNGGNDYFTVGSGDKVADGGDGIDTIDIAEFAFTPIYTSDGITVSLALQGTAQDTGAGIWTISNMENVGGFTGDDELTGDDNANVLAGHVGNDTLDGGAGDDTLAGDGTFIFDGAEQQFIAIDSEDGPGGNDWLRGGAGNDHLIGGGGDDFLSEYQSFGPWGDDIYDGGDGNDRVSYFTDANQGVTVDLRLDGVAQNTGLGNDTLIGIEHVTAGYGDDTLIGNESGNWFWAFSGTDTLIGNGGDDYFTVGLGTKHIDGGEGADTLEIIDMAFAPAYTADGVTISLLTQGESQETGIGSFWIDGIENLSGFYGSDSFTGDNGVNILAGEAGDDTLLGRAGDDVLAGDGTFGLDNGNAGAITFFEQAVNAAGDDLLEGGLGNDTLIGGEGTDTAAYYHAQDSVTVNLASGTASGADGDDTLAGIENVMGSNFNDSITGDTEANRLDGRAGADTMNGGLGDDTYIVDNAGDDVVESASTGGTDLVQSSVDFGLAGTWVENLTLTGSGSIDGTGNGLANTLIGNSAANTLNGAGGADIMKGGAGDDIYYVDNVDDTVAETSTGGIDKVNSSVSFRLGNYIENLTLTGSAESSATGNSLANLIYGNSAANVINGGAGADTMRGGAGDDSYIVDNADDRVIETASAGTDLVKSSVTFRLASNVEDLTLTGTAAINGTGNTLDNLITGNSAANIIDGGTGADILKGGAGNDTYLVDDAADVVSESSTGGIDLVKATVSFTLAAYVENLTLSGVEAIDGTGNTAANTIVGNSAANVLNGAAGADTLKGGAGNDTYIVDNAGDVISEASTGGVDSVQSTVSYTLAGYVENLILTGSHVIDATGNTGANVLVGNSAANTIEGLAGTDTIDGGAGNDRISGGTGIDTLTGGLGADTFVFDALLSASSNVDTITDFSAASDSIYLSNTVFKALPEGTLASAAFFAGTAAHDADDRVIYDATTGNIFYDADGNGGGAAILFAHVTAGTSLTNADFLIGG